MKNKILCFGCLSAPKKLKLDDLNTNIAPSVSKVSPRSFNKRVQESHAVIKTNSKIKNSIILTNEAFYPVYCSNSKTPDYYEVNNFFKPKGNVTDESYVFIDQCKANKLKIIAKLLESYLKIKKNESKTLFKKEYYEISKQVSFEVMIFLLDDYSEYFVNKTNSSVLVNLVSAMMFLFENYALYCLVSNEKEKGEKIDKEKLVEIMTYHFCCENISFLDFQKILPKFISYDQDSEINDSKNLLEGVLNNSLCCEILYLISNLTNESILNVLNIITFDLRKEENFLIRNAITTYFNNMKNLKLL